MEREPRLNPFSNFMLGRGRGGFGGMGGTSGDGSGGNGGAGNNSHQQ
jgi:hypothetical protein